MVARTWWKAYLAQRCQRSDLCRFDSGGKTSLKLAGDYGKRAIVNGGAKNSIVIMPDTAIDRSISPIISSFFGNSGQRCLAGANLIPVGEETHEKLVRKFSKAAANSELGMGSIFQPKWGR